MCLKRAPPPLDVTLLTHPLSSLATATREKASDARLTLLRHAAMAEDWENDTPLERPPPPYQRAFPRRVYFIGTCNGGARRDSRGKREVRSVSLVFPFLFFRFPLTLTGSGPARSSAEAASARLGRVGWLEGCRDCAGRVRAPARPRARPPRSFLLSSPSPFSLHLSRSLSLAASCSQPQH